MVRMGNYETFEFEGTVSVDTEKDGEVKGFDDGQVAEYLDSALDVMFERDIREARLTTDNDDSYIHLYQQEVTTTPSSTD